LYFSIETLPNGTFVSFGDNLILMMDIYNIWMMLEKNVFKNSILLLCKKFHMIAPPPVFICIALICSVCIYSHEHGFRIYRNCYGGRG